MEEVAVGLFDPLVEMLKDDELAQVIAANMGGLGLDEIVDLPPRTRTELERANDLDHSDIPSRELTELIGGNLVVAALAQCK